MYHHQPTNPEAVRKPIERIVTLRCLSSFVHRPRSNIRRPEEYLFLRKNETSIPLGNETLTPDPPMLSFPATPSSPRPNWGRQSGDR